MRRIKENDARDGWYEIDPETARLWLDTQPKNRPITAAKVATLAEEMLHGRFLANGETLVFDEAGLLMDGQGRCAACVKSGVPFVAYCVWGVPRAMFPTFDVVERRTAGQVLAIAGSRSWFLVASVLRWVAVMSGGTTSPSTSSRLKVSNQTILDLYRVHGESVLESIEFARSCSASWDDEIVGIIQPSILIYLHLVTKRYDRERADSFVRGMVTGQNLTAGSPILTFRNRRITGSRQVAYEVMAQAIKAMNAHLAGKTTRLSRWSSREAYPELRVPGVPQAASAH